MERTHVTRTWPMRYVGIWCVFGDWKFDYSTLKEAIADPGVEIVCVYTNQVTLKEVPTLSQDWGLHSSFCIEEHKSVGEIADRVLGSLSTKRSFCGAVCFNESELALANQLNRILGAPIPSQRAIRRLIDKHTFYTTLSNAGLPTARFHLWKSESDLEQLLERGLYRQGYYVLKPTGGSDSAGVYRSRPHEDLHTSFLNYRACCQESARIGLTNLDKQTSLIMEYIDYDGTPVEVTADGVVADGKVILHVVHEKLHTAAFSPFYDRRMVAPPCSPEVLTSEEKIAEATCKLVSALQFTDGVFHLEYRLTREECIPIDCAFRPGGGFIPHAIYALTGVDLILAHVQSHFQGTGNQRLPSIVPVTGGSCIGAIYTLPEADPEVFGRLVAYLEQREEILGLHAKQRSVHDPRFTVDACLSLGVLAHTSEKARTLFEHFIEPYAKVGSR